MGRCRTRCSGGVGWLGRRRRGRSRLSRRFTITLSPWRSRSRRAGREWPGPVRCGISRSICFRRMPPSCLRMGPSTRGTSSFRPVLIRGWWRSLGGSKRGGIRRIGSCARRGGSVLGRASGTGRARTCHGFWMPRVWMRNCRIGMLAPCVSTGNILLG